MLDRIAVAVVVSLTLSPSIGAQNCEALIGLSKVVSTVVSDKSSVEKHAENFCSEYSRSKASGGSTSFGVSYKFLSASLGRSDTSAEAVAAKYCSASNLEKAAVDAYQQYVETIAPNAYASYESCIAAGQSVRFGDATVLPEELGLSMSFVGLSTADTQATLSFVASRDVTCTWDAARANRVTVRAGGTAKLTCNRRDASRQSFVLISRVDGTQSRGFQINWRKYDKDGNVVDSVAALQARIEGVEQRVVALAAPPSAVEASCRPESYWMACAAACKPRQKVSGGNCFAGNTFGAGVALESAGVQRGPTADSWYCRWVEARGIGAGAVIDTRIAGRVVAYCAD